LLDTDAVAAALCVTPRHIQRLVSERRIPHVKVGRFVRFDPDELRTGSRGTRWLPSARLLVSTRLGGSVDGYPGGLESSLGASMSSGSAGVRLPTRDLSEGAAP
jgi:excisionase family DNA binding protein